MGSGTGREVIRRAGMIRRPVGSSLSVRLGLRISLSLATMRDTRLRSYAGRIRPWVRTLRNFAHVDEKLFCDMEAQVVYPFCDESNRGQVCFDYEAKKLSHPVFDGVSRVSVNPYSHVRDWRGKKADKTG